MAESMRQAFLEAGIANGEQAARQPAGRENVGQVERWVSMIGGGALALYGLTRRSPGGVVLALVGGSLIYRGITGYCHLYGATGLNTARGETSNPRVSVPAGHGIKVEKSVSINRPPSDLYAFWRRFENLPRFMKHLESVTAMGANRSHWVARAPAGSTVEWDAEIINEKENELIAWRSLEGSDVDNAGSVHFTPTSDGRGTMVKISLKYDPPGGVVGAAIAKLFGEEPARQIDDDLNRFKQLMEIGDAATSSSVSSASSG